MRQHGHHSLNRENVASHLQKYRAKMKAKLEGEKECTDVRHNQDLASSASLTSEDGVSQSQIGNSSEQEVEKNV